MLKTALLVLRLFQVSECHGFTLMCYIRMGIQNGKGSIDAHFSIAMKHVVWYCNMVNCVLTPSDLDWGLRLNGGVINSIAEIIGINRGKLQEFVT